MPVFLSEEVKYLDFQLRQLSASQQHSIDNVGDEESEEEDEDVAGGAVAVYELHNRTSNRFVRAGYSWDISLLGLIQTASCRSVIQLITQTRCFSVSTHSEAQSLLGSASVSLLYICIRTSAL